MGLELGIVGLPNVGKSTLFKAVTSAPAEAANYPFCTIEPNVGIVSVPDRRLDRLESIFKSEKKIPNTLKIVDIAGLVKGASKGEGLGAKFLDNIRQVDAIVHLVRCFEGGDVIHVNDRVDPVDDAEIIKTELILSDLEAMERKVEKIKRDSKGAKKNQETFLETSQKLLDHLSDFKFASAFESESESEALFLKGLNLLTAKPFFYLLNVSENEMFSECELEKQMRELAAKEGVNALKICCSLEAELSELGEEEKNDYLKEFGEEKSGLEKMIREGYELLDQISFFTAGPKEARAWNLKKGSPAPKAAGKIHSDIERGFIRAETYHFDDIDALGTEQEVRGKGKMRIEGQDYVVKDGDVLHFRFNV